MPSMVMAAIKREEVESRASKVKVTGFTGNWDPHSPEVLELYRKRTERNCRDTSPICTCALSIQRFEGSRCRGGSQRGCERQPQVALGSGIGRKILRPLPRSDI